MICPDDDLALFAAKISALSRDTESAPTSDPSGPEWRSRLSSVGASFKQHLSRRRNALLSIPWSFQLCPLVIQVIRTASPLRRLIRPFASHNDSQSPGKDV